MTEIRKTEREIGFSLIELLVAIAVLAILSVIAVPAYNDFVASSKVRDAATELMQEMKLARIMAIKTSTPYVIAFNTPAANMYTIGADPANTGAPGNYGTTGAPRVINLQNTYGPNIQFGSTPATAPSDAPESCPLCMGVAGTPVSFGVANPLQQTFNIDGTVNDPPGYALITHAVRNMTYMVKMSFQTAKLELWAWDGNADNIMPPVVADCNAPQRRCCGWTEIR
jgi:prepilin-type N-terminal cleavage/methylation domain-containing protein